MIYLLSFQLVSNIKANEVVKNLCDFRNNFQFIYKFIELIC